MKTHPSRQRAVLQTPGRTATPGSAPLQRATHPAAIIQRARANLGALTPADILQLQRTIGNRAVGQLLAQGPQHQLRQAPQRRTAGLPASLKSGIESLSGIAVDTVAVHYDSSHPAKLNALAYTQGNEIHLAPGQEKHLPHEAWHVVQQAQGRVNPTMQMKNGVPVNDDNGLEREADIMGARALTPAAQRRSRDEEFFQARLVPEAVAQQLPEPLPVSGYSQPARVKPASIQRKVAFEAESAPGESRIHGKKNSEKEGAEPQPITGTREVLGKTGKLGIGADNGHLEFVTDPSNPKQDDLGRPAAALVYHPQANAVMQPKPAATAVGGRRLLAGNAAAGAPMRLKSTPPVSQPRMAPRPRVTGVGPARSGPVIQRLVGFEYEIPSALTYRTEQPLTDEQLRNWDSLEKEEVKWLEKGTVLIANMAGLHAKADETSSGKSDLELETDAFPETRDGRNRLTNALETLKNFCQFIAESRQHLRASNLARKFKGAAGDGNLYIMPGDKVIQGNPQATVGVLLEKVGELMERTVGGPTSGLLTVPRTETRLPRLELGTAEGSTDFQNVGDAPGRVREGIRVSLPFHFPSDALVGLCALMLTYIQKGVAGTHYAKGIAPLMARTDFGSMFKTDLPSQVQGFLGADNGKQFIEMWKRILQQLPQPFEITDPLFAQEPIGWAEKNYGVSKYLTRERWIRGISQGKDKLTSNNFPWPKDVVRDEEHRNVLLGLGGMGAKHDYIKQGIPIAAPILELRRMTKNVPPGEFREIAMRLFDYVVVLNSAPEGVHPAYGDVRPLVKKKEYRP